MEGERIANLKVLFGQHYPLVFGSAFSTHEGCLKILASAKWADGFVCRNCDNDKYCRGKTPFSRRCTRCKRDESATAHTIFHHCRLELPKAFEIASLVCGTPGIPATEISKVLETRHMTCLNFKKRILLCLQSDGGLMVENRHTVLPTYTTDIYGK